MSPYKVFLSKGNPLTVGSHFKRFVKAGDVFPNPQRLINDDSDFPFLDTPLLPVFLSASLPLFPSFLPSVERGSRGQKPLDPID